LERSACRATLQVMARQLAGYACHPATAPAFEAAGGKPSIILALAECGGTGSEEVLCGFYQRHLESIHAARLPLAPATLVKGLCETAEMYRQTLALAHFTAFDPRHPAYDPVRVHAHLREARPRPAPMRSFTPLELAHASTALKEVAGFVEDALQSDIYETPPLPAFLAAGGSVELLARMKSAPGLEATSELLRAFSFGRLDRSRMPRGFSALVAALESSLLRYADALLEAPETKPHTPDDDPHI
jgi:hypothetical protein